MTTCDALLSVSIPGTFGPIRVPCAQSRYLRRWTDTTGREHVSCPIHLAEMTHRWPVGDVAPEPVASVFVSREEADALWPRVEA